MSRVGSSAHAHGSFAADVLGGLEARPKTLPSKYFYDALGSHLFEAICQLPWYAITRAESALLAAHAGAMIAGVAAPARLVELGCGSGEKIAVLAEAIAVRDGSLGIDLIDVSRAALDLSERRLGRIGGVSSMRTHLMTYEAGLAEIPPHPPGSVLALLLGSNIGNFDHPAALALLTAVRRALRPGDGLLLGADLVKPEADLILAYADPLGVTEAFNKNLLLRINRELGGHFDIGSFSHRAVWNAKASRVEMHLVSRRAQTIAVDGLGAQFRFVEGETIWTESSTKYTAESIADLARRAGFHSRQQWIDPEARFATSLFVAGPQ